MLSISGYHMAVVAGIVFFVLRALFALIPAFANRHPIKKWAALAALVAAAFYLVLSGAEVATQRSFIMIAIVLIGVMVDRPALTFRTLTVAAIRRAAAGARSGGASELPDVVCGDAGARRGLSARVAMDERRRPTRRSAREIALWGGREIVGLILVSLLAGTRDDALHRLSFSSRLAPYGVIANLLAMPVVSALGDAGGHSRGDRACRSASTASLWRLMGDGIDWMIAVALWVASFPGARRAHRGVRHRSVAALHAPGWSCCACCKTPLRLIGACR